MSVAMPPVRELEKSAAVGPQLYRLIRDRIVRGELPPGLRLSETEFAAAYDVSRQPVREAFIKLSEENLAAVRPKPISSVWLPKPPAMMRLPRSTRKSSSSAP